MHIFFYLLFLVLFIYEPNSVTCCCTHHQHRRILHQPFQPQQQAIPPTQPPSPSQSQPQPPPQQPKFPFSTTTPAKPTFFPSYPSPPPPPPHPSGDATFPANISSLILPQSSHKKPISPKLIVVAVLLSVCFLAFVFSLILLVYFHRRHRRTAPPKNNTNNNFRSDSHRLFPSNLSHYSDGGDHKPPRRPPSVSSTNNSSEFLYLGTLVNSRGGVDTATTTTVDNGASPYRKLDSPELHPLPPLSRHNFNFSSRRNTSSEEEEDEEDEEEFYSPRGSSADKESPSLLRSTSATLFAADEQTSHLNPRTSTSTSTSSTTSSHRSYPTSTSASHSPQQPRLPSPTFSSTRTFKSTFPLPVVAPPPPPPPPLRPMTPSPPKRKPPSPSPPYSPPKPNPSTHPRFLRNHPYPHTTTNTAGFSRQPPPPPPPPPPPAPQTTQWDSLMHLNPPASTPPLLITPVKHVAFHNPAAVSPAEFIENPPLAEDTPKPKLKPLHWDKVRASSDRAMVWDQLKSSSFQLNEEMIETLFVVNANNVNHKESTWRPVLPSPNNENRVLDPKKSQNIAILLRALNVTIEEVCEALLEGNADTLGNDLLESLLKMAPTKEEERKLKEYKDDSPFKLGPAERFLKAVLDIPFAFKRVDAMLYIANFDSEVDYLKKSFETLEVACEELRNSRMFMKLLEAVLKTGNRMNVGTNRGDAHAFKLDTLLKLVDVKGTDGKTTLLHFVVQEIIRAEGSRLSNANQSLAAKSQQDSFQSEVEFRKLGLQVVSSLSGELSNVKKAASMDSDVLSNDVSALSRGIGNIGEVVRLNESSGLKENSERFSCSMNSFLKKAEEEIIRVQAQESVALSLVKEITEYFHGNSAKEEAHPFRIFTVVRDFLSILDQVCREVGKINERTIVSSARQFPVPVNPTQPPVFPVFHVRQQYSSSDEESSSLSS